MRIRRLREIAETTPRGLLLLLMLMNCIDASGCREQSRAAGRDRREGDRLGQIAIKLILSKPKSS